MKGMKYAILCSALSLVFYYHNLMIGGGFWGYMAGIIYLFTYRAHSTLLAIGCIATAILTVMYFPWEFTLKGLSAGRRRLVDDDHRAHCGADGGLSAA